MEKKETYELTQIIIENVLIAVHIALGAWAMVSIPYLSIIYVVFLLFMLLFFLRKHLCTHCYYYGKLCHCGWSNLAKIFEPNSGNLKIAKPAAGITWGVLVGLPIIVTAGLCVFDFGMLRIVQLALLILFAIVQVMIHKKDCKTCKHSENCVSSM